MTSPCRVRRRYPTHVVEQRERRGVCLELVTVAGAERFSTDARFARQAGTAPIPVSTGKRQRHRLHRGGDRQLNRALHTIAITRARRDAQTRAYLDRKMAEGKTRKEALRCLKRHLARRFRRLLLEPTTMDTTPVNALPNIACLT